MTQMDRERSSRPVMPELPAGWTSLVDANSGKTLFLNSVTKDLVFSLIEVFKIAALAELTGAAGTPGVGQLGPTPGVPAVASAPVCTQREEETDDGSAAVATVYSGSPARPYKRPSAHQKATKKKKARSTVSLSTQLTQQTQLDDENNIVPGYVHVTPDTRRSTGHAYTDHAYTQPGQDNDEYAQHQQHTNVCGRDESIATADLPKTDDFLDFKLPSPSESATESESDDSSEVRSQNLLEGGDY
jgi:hypothetical protein